MKVTTSLNIKYSPKDYSSKAILSKNDVKNIGKEPKIITKLKTHITNNTQAKGTKHDKETTKADDSMSEKKELKKIDSKKIPEPIAKSVPRKSIPVLPTKVTKTRTFRRLSVPLTLIITADEDSDLPQQFFIRLSHAVQEDKPKLIRELKVI